MRITTLSVGLEIRRSNNDYGSDKAEVTLNAALEPNEEPEMVLRILLDMARAQVEGDLKRSPSLTVRRALIREVRTCNRCGQALADEERSYMHEACRQAEDAEREARRAEQLRGREERNRQLDVVIEDEDRELVRTLARRGDDDDDEDGIPL